MLTGEVCSVNYVTMEIVADNFADYTDPSISWAILCEFITYIIPVKSISGPDCNTTKSGNV